MHDALFDNQDRLGEPLYFDLAVALGLPLEDLREALAKGIYADKVHKDFIGGVRSGAKGAPSFFVNGERLDGPYGFYSLADAIEAALFQAHSSP
jgi:protein-disulfide isomerase